MYKMLRFISLGALLSILVGCAGKNFVRPTSDTFQLGKTTYNQVIDRMGEPRKTGEALKNDKPIKSATYAYAATGGEPLEEGVIPARAMVYYFYNDTLVGHEFLSSFKSDNSNFDNTKIENIKKGQTSRVEVINILGKPTASFIQPMVKNTSGEAIGYTYQTTRGGVFSSFKLFNKSLRISFDEKDIVSDLDYSSSGNK